MKQYIYIGIIASFVFAVGCKTSDHDTGKPETHRLEDGTEVIVLSLPKKSAAEIQQLTKDANAGDGKAADSLAVYYDGAGNDFKKARKYYALAEKLRCPQTLGRIAFSEWTRNPTPDLNKIEEYARIAAQAGVKRADEVLAEIVEARASGVIPNKTKLRLIVPEIDNPPNAAGR